jgi:nitroreductase
MSIKKLFSASFKQTVKDKINDLDTMLIRLFARSSWLASLYYCFFSRQFRREHKAVLQGRLAYKATLKEIKQSSALLRRNVHRLEKGLIMQPRREVFAEAYILETISCYQLAIASASLCTEEKQWATDVLAEYFAVTGSSKAIDKARLQFQALNQNGKQQSVPYPHAALPASPLDYPQLMQLFRRRRSVRWFQPQAVPEQAIRQAVNAASLAPSACNRQPYEFYVVNNAEKAVRVAKCAMGTAGFAENIPCVVAVVGDLSAYPAERDRHVIYIDGGLAAMQFMLACETLGLSTCPINWPDIEQREQMLARELDLAYHQRTIMLIAVGYAQPEGGIPFSQKKTDKLLVKDIY